jgi:hypothetical protein
MTDSEYALKLDELDQLLNDPDVPMQPARIWSLLAELSVRDRSIPLSPAQLPERLAPIKNS